MDCIFCKIVNGELPVNLIYEHNFSKGISNELKEMLDKEI